MEDLEFSGKNMIWCNGPIHVLSAELNFYKQLKVVNFIRRRIHQKMCFSCHQVYATQDALVGHMTDSKHIQDIPDNTEWDQPE